MKVDDYKIKFVLLVIISLYPLVPAALSISTPSISARTRKGRLQPLITDQIIGTRSLVRVQLQARFEEFHDPQDFFRRNVSARSELAFKSFLRYHPCKCSYWKQSDCIDSFKNCSCTFFIEELFSQLGHAHRLLFDLIPCHRHKPTNYFTVVF